MIQGDGKIFLAMKEQLKNIVTRQALDVSGAREIWEIIKQLTQVFHRAQLRQLEKRYRVR